MSYQPGEWRPVAELLHRVAPHMSAAGAAKLILAQVAKDKEIEAAVVTRCYDSLRPVTTRNERCSPDPAPARERSTRQTDIEESLSKPTAVDLVAQAIRDAEWYGAELPKTETPETYAAKLLRTWKDTSPQHVHEASMWLLNNPGKRKKYLGGFLTNWMRNAGKFAAASQQTLPSTSARHGMGDDEGYTDGPW